MGKTTPIKILQVGLTLDERRALDAIAARENVSLASIMRELLADKYPDFREVHRPRSGYGGGGGHV
jgi:hypothetical protein